MNKTLIKILLELGHDQDEIEQMNVNSVGASAFQSDGIYSTHGKAILASTVAFKILGVDVHNFRVTVEPYSRKLRPFVVAKNLPTYTSACRYIENLVNVLEGGS